MSGIEGEYTIIKRDVETLEIKETITSKNVITAMSFYRWVKGSTLSGGVSSFSSYPMIFTSSEILVKNCRSLIRLNSMLTYNAVDELTSFPKTDITPDFARLYVRIQPPPISESRAINSVGLGTTNNFVFSYVSLNETCVQLDNEVLDIYYRVQAVDLFDLKSLNDEYGNLIDGPFARDISFDELFSILFGHSFGYTSFDDLSISYLPGPIHNSSTGLVKGGSYDVSELNDEVNYYNDRDTLLGKFSTKIDLPEDAAVGRLLGVSNNIDKIFIPTYNSTISPVQPIHNHNKDSKTPFTNVDFLSTGFSSINIKSGTWDNRDNFTNRYRIQINEGGSLAESRYSLYKTNMIHYNGNSYDNYNYTFPQVFKDSLTNTIKTIPYLIQYTETKVLHWDTTEIQIKDLLSQETIELKTTTSENQNGIIPSEYISFVVVDSSKFIWISTDNGIIRIDPTFDSELTRVYYSHLVVLGISLGFNDSITGVCENNLIITKNSGSTWNVYSNTPTGAELYYGMFFYETSPVIHQVSSSKYRDGELVILTKSEELGEDYHDIYCRRLNSIPEIELASTHWRVFVNSRGSTVINHIALYEDLGRTIEHLADVIKVNGVEITPSDVYSRETSFNLTQERTELNIDYVNNLYEPKDKVIDFFFDSPVIIRTGEILPISGVEWVDTGVTFITFSSLSRVFYNGRIETVGSIDGKLVNNEISYFVNYNSSDSFINCGYREGRLPGAHLLKTFKESNLWVIPQVENSYDKEVSGGGISGIKRWEWGTSNYREFAREKDNASVGNLPGFTSTGTFSSNNYDTTFINKFGNVCAIGMFGTNNETSNQSRIFFLKASTINNDVSGEELSDISDFYLTSFSRHKIESIIRNDEGDWNGISILKTENYFQLKNITHGVNYENSWGHINFPEQNSMVMDTHWSRINYNPNTGVELFDPFYETDGIDSSSYLNNAKRINFASESYNFSGFCHLDISESMRSTFYSPHTGYFTIAMTIVPSFPTLTNTQEILWSTTEKSGLTKGRNISIVWRTWNNKVAIMDDYSGGDIIELMDTPELTDENKEDEIRLIFIFTPGSVEGYINWESMGTQKDLPYAYNVSSNLVNGVLDSVTTLGSKANPGEFFFRGKISNYQLWDVSWDGNNISWEYQNPTLLITDDNGELLKTYSNLVAHFKLDELELSGTETKLTSTSEQTLIDGLTISFDQPTIEPAFVKEDFYTFGVFNGIMKDDATSFITRYWVGFKPENFWWNTFYRSTISSSIENLTINCELVSSNSLGANVINEDISPGSERSYATFGSFFIKRNDAKETFPDRSSKLISRLTIPEGQDGFFEVTQAAPPTEYSIENTNGISYIGAIKAGGEYVFELVEGTLSGRVEVKTSINYSAGTVYRVERVNGFVSVYTNGSLRESRAYTGEFGLGVDGKWCGTNVKVSVNWYPFAVGIGDVQSMNGAFSNDFVSVDTHLGNFIKLKLDGIDVASVNYPTQTSTIGSIPYPAQGEVTILPKQGLILCSPEDEGKTLSGSLPVIFETPPLV